MFLYGDIVKAPKHKYIVVSIDDSNPKDVQYGLIPATKANVKHFNLTGGVNNCSNPKYWYRASVLEFVERT